MSLIGGGFNPFGRGLFNVLDTAEMLLKDVKTEGKKEGYEQASKEYEQAFQLIENEYKEAKELIAKEKSSYSIRSEKLIAKLENLELQQKRLENEIEDKAKQVAWKYDIPFSTVMQATAGGSIFDAYDSLTSILSLIYSVREKQLKDARQKGYLEAKELYEEKIGKLRKNLLELKEKGNKDIQEYLNMINELLDAISKKQMEIAELRILL